MGILCMKCTQIDWNKTEPSGCSNCGNDIPSMFMRVEKEDFVKLSGDDNVIDSE